MPTSSLMLPGSSGAGVTFCTMKPCSRDKCAAPYPLLLTVARTKYRTEARRPSYVSCTKSTFGNRNGSTCTDGCRHDARAR